MLSLNDFDTQINAQIVQRGLVYFNDQSIVRLEEASSGKWIAEVEGTEDYIIKIALSGKNIRSTSCNCPYDGGPVCKHVVAVLFALRERVSDKRSKDRSKDNKSEFEDLLSKIDLEELRGFMRYLQQDDLDLGDKFIIYFAEKSSTKDISEKYKKLIKQIIRHHSHRGFIDYRQTYSLSKEIQQVISLADNALAGKNYRDAFTIGKLLCLEFLQVIQSCDDSAGNIGSCLTTSVSILSKIAEAETVSPELLDQLLEFFTQSLPDKEWFDYGNYGYEMLNIAEKVALRTGADAYLRLLDALLKIHAGKYSDYSQEYFTIAKIRFLKTIGHLNASEQLIAENMHIVEIRKELTKQAMDNKDFERAKKLIYEGIRIAQEKGHPGTVVQWEDMLLLTAIAGNELGLSRTISKKLAFDRGFDRKYYQLWKGTYSPKEWVNVIEDHIQTVETAERTKQRKSIWDNMEIALFQRLSPVFIEEKMWSRLLDLLPPTAGEGMLSIAHPHLAPSFPSEMLTHYVRILTDLGDKAGNRSDYQHIADLMQTVKKDIINSHAVINNLAVDLISKYPRRPAMIEVLSKVIGKR